jgi:CRP/FNR family transcriptional regulator, cyclic AMP receptor protein
MWPQQVANRFCSERGALQTATVMANQEKKVPFDPKVFLATVNGGRSISKYRMHQKVFSQGNSADAVFHYIQKGNVKITVSGAKKPSSQYWGRMNSAERDA